MITLITGVPGDGKTLRAMYLIAQEIKNGVSVYSNIEGASHPPIPENDWRQTPDGSLVVYDEAQTEYPSAKPGRSSDSRVTAMETHRHTGHNLMFITQHPSLISHHVRRLTGRHEHVRRIFGTERALLLSREEAFSPDDKKALKSCSTEYWSYPKNLFNQYKSATMHNVKRRVPLKVWFSFGGIAALALAAILLFPSVIGLTQPDLAQVADNAVNGANAPELPDSVAAGLPAAQVQSMSMVVNRFNPVSDVRAMPIEIAGCVSSLRACQCYDANGSPIMTTDMVCRAFIEKPITRNLSVRGGGSQPDEGEQHAQ